MSPLSDGAVRLVDAALEATVVLSFSRLGYTVRSSLHGWPHAGEFTGTGRRLLVTGGNSGLGYATASALLGAGAQVLISVRDHAKGEATLAHLRADLGDETADHAGYDVLDLADLASVRRFAAARRDERLPLHGIVHNAGAMFATREVTVDGLERTYQTHVVAPFRLTAELLPLLTADGPTRVITVSSGGMYTEKLEVATLDSPTDFQASVAYARAKRAQVTLTAEWQRRFGDTGVSFHVAHPGWALTPGLETSLPRFRRVVGPLLRTAEQGADTIHYLALSDQPEERPGRLWHDRRVRGEHKLPWTHSGRDEAAALWARVCHDAEVDPRRPTCD